MLKDLAAWLAARRSRLVPDARRARLKRARRLRIESLEGRSLMSVAAVSHPAMAQVGRVEVRPLGAEIPSGVVYKKGVKVSDPVVRQDLESLAQSQGWFIRVHSGDRDFVPEGGAKNSRHLAKMAVDLRIYDASSGQRISDEQAWNAIRESRKFDVGYQVIQHDEFTKTEAPHLHIGRYNDSRPSRFMIEGQTRKQKGKYTNFGPIFDHTTPGFPFFPPPVNLPPVVTPPVITPPVITPPVVTPPVITPPVVTPPTSASVYRITSRGSFVDGPFFGAAGGPTTVSVPSGADIGATIAAAFSEYFTADADRMRSRLKPSDRMAEGPRQVTLSDVITNGSTVTGNFRSEGGGGSEEYWYRGGFTATLEV